MQPHESPLTLGRSAAEAQEGVAVGGPGLSSATAPYSKQVKSLLHSLGEKLTLLRVPGPVVWLTMP